MTDDSKKKQGNDRGAEKPKSSDPVVTSTKKPPDPNRPAPEPVVTATKRVEAKLEPAPTKRTEPKPEPAKGGATTVPEPVVKSVTADRASTSTQKPRAAFVEPTLAAVDALDCESLAICICSDVRPLAGLAGYVDWRMCGRISDLLRKGVVTGASREKVLVPTQGRVGQQTGTGPKRIFLFGWGPQKSILDGATERLAWMVDVLQTAKIERVAIALPEPAIVLMGLVDDHVRKPLGDKCAFVFGPDPILADAVTASSKDTRPIPAPLPGPSAS